MQITIEIKNKKFEDIEGIIKSRRLKNDRQYNCQKKKDKQGSTKKTQYWARRTHKTLG